MPKIIFTSIIIYSCLLNFTEVPGQSSLRNKFFEADYALQLNDFEKALRLFKELHKRDPENAMYNYRVGECYINLPDNKKLALPYLEKAVERVSEDFKHGNFSEENAPVETYYLLAKAYHVNENLDKAADYYKMYLTYTNDKEKIAITNNQIKACEYAKLLISNPVYIEIQKLENPINSTASEIYPVISEDETMLVYLVINKNLNSVYYARKENGQWTNPKNINNVIGSFGDTYPSSISADKKRLYFTLKNFFTSDIGYSINNNERWSKIKELKKPVNTKSWDSHPFESADGNELYFISDRKGGYGNLDIYKSVKNSKGDWDKPVNLGNTINTPFNEIMPIISPDGKELYFCSEGHSSIGGYDIFLTTKTGENTWSEPVNLGYPINTTDDNVYFRPVKNGIIAYTSLPQPEDIGSLDIYRMEIFSEKNPRRFLLKGNLAMENSFSYFGDCKLAIVDADKADTIGITLVDAASGEYQYSLISGNYKLVYFKDMYESYTEELYLTNDYPQSIIEINPKLEKLPEEIPMVDITDIPHDEITADITSQTQNYELPAAENDKAEKHVILINEQDNDFVDAGYTDYDVENYTQYKAEEIYTIQIMALKNPVRTDFFKNTDGVMVQIGSDGFYRYIAGKYDNLGKAKYDLKNTISQIYASAFVRKYDLSQYLTKNTGKPSQSFVKETYKVIDDNYTIQIMALYNPVPVTYFKNLNDINISYGTDKIFRYTYKKYSTYEFAKAEIKKIQDMGYKKAFIRTISGISNY